LGVVGVGRLNYERRGCLIAELPAFVIGLLAQGCVFWRLGLDSGVARFDSAGVAIVVDKIRLFPLLFNKGVFFI